MTIERENRKLNFTREDWNVPYSFFNHKYKVQDQNGNTQRVIAGSLGTFLGEW